MRASAGLDRRAPIGGQAPASRNIGREARHIGKLGEAFARQLRLAARDERAVLRIVDRVAEKTVEVGLASPASADFQRHAPSVNRAGHSVGRERAARRDGGKSLPPVKTGIDIHAGPAGGANGHGIASRLADQPVAVAAKAGHMRIDHGQRRRRRDHRLDG